MRKVFVFSAMVLAMTFIAGPSFAAKVCLQDNFGAFWELKGGRIDKKSYTVKRIPASLACASPGNAEVTLTASGNLVLTAFTAQDTTGACNSVQWSADVNLLFSGGGTFDIVGNGTNDGGFTIGPISCALLPPTKPDKAKPINQNNNDPAIKKQ